MKLLKAYMTISEQLAPMFKQHRTALRAQRLLVANLLCVGKHWVTRMLCATGRDQQQWSSDYRLFSRSPWKTQHLFKPAASRSLEYLKPGEPICIAGDETKIRRAGRKVRRARWMRDPLSPPFHVNFIKGIRVVQFAVVLPLHRIAGVAARSIPVLFEPVEAPAKPGPRPCPAAQQAYRKAKKNNTMCDQAVEHIRTLRKFFDDLDASAHPMLYMLDGGFCNAKIFKAMFDRCWVLARCRKDAKLCFRACDPDRPNKKYGDRKFTPESVRTDSRRPWRKGQFFLGGKFRKLRYKQLRNVLWQRGAGLKPLRLIVLAPIPYQLSIHSRLNYREPAFLLTDAEEMSTQELIQAYLDRWQIEVNHRDEKQQMGVGDPQVWNAKSVDRLPAFIVASYSFLLLASLEAYGAKRTDSYIQPPRWQRRRSRPSCQDLLAQIRREAMAHPQLIEPSDCTFDPAEVLIKAAA